MTFTGSLPCTAMIDSIAFRAKRFGPLLLTAPRATIASGNLPKFLTRAAASGGDDQRSSTHGWVSYIM